MTYEEHKNCPSCRGASWLAIGVYCLECNARADFDQDLIKQHPSKAERKDLLIRDTGWQLAASEDAIAYVEAHSGPLSGEEDLSVRWQGIIAMVIMAAIVLAGIATY